MPAMLIWLNKIFQISFMAAFCHITNPSTNLYPEPRVRVRDRARVAVGVGARGRGRGRVRTRLRVGVGVRVRVGFKDSGRVQSGQKGVKMSFGRLWHPWTP